MDHEHITLEIDYGTRGRLEFQLPADVTDEEVAYFKTLTPRVENGLLGWLTRIRAQSSSDAAHSC